MNQVIEIALIAPLLIIMYQFYNFSIKRKGVDRQKSCQTLGIIYCTIGIAALVIRSPFFVVTGLLLLMFGFRLIAYGLDRINKNVFIDRFEEDK